MTSPLHPSTLRRYRTFDFGDKPAFRTPKSPLEGSTPDTLQLPIQQILTVLQHRILARFLHLLDPASNLKSSTICPCSSNVLKTSVNTSDLMCRHTLQHRNFVRRVPRGVNVAVRPSIIVIGDGQSSYGVDRRSAIASDNVPGVSRCAFRCACSPDNFTIQVLREGERTAQTYAIACSRQLTATYRIGIWSVTG